MIRDCIMDVGSICTLRDVSKDSNFKLVVGRGSSPCGKLLCLGMHPGRTFRVLFRLWGGAIIVGSGSTRIAIDSALASSVVVNLV